MKSNHYKILLGMALGIASGLAFNERVVFLGDFSKLVIQLIKVFATPLLFFTIVEALLHTSITKKDAGSLFFVTSINAVLAAAIGIFLSNTLRPGEWFAMPTSIQPLTPEMQLAQSKSLSFTQFLSGVVPTSVLQPFVDNAILSVVMMALLFGVVLNRLKANTKLQFETVQNLVDFGLEASKVILQLVLKLVPFAVFCAVAKVVGAEGLAPLRSLSGYLLVGLLGLFLHVVIVYHTWIYFICRVNLKHFWKIAISPVSTAFGTNSSLATLPLTLEALEKLKVSERGRSLGACIGTNFNNDGIILYEAMAVLFVAQIHHLNLDLHSQIVAAFGAIVAAAGIAGIPEAGFISLAVVLSTLNLPVEVLPLLLTVDWIMGRARSVVNSLGDMVVSMGVDKVSGKLKTTK